MELRRRHAPAGEEYHPCLRPAEMLGGELRSTGKTNIDFRRLYPAFLGREQDVAGEIQGETGADRGSVGRADDRLEAVHRRAEELPRQSVVADVVVRSLGQPDALFDVGAR